jgi:hypothetical protein
MHEMFLDENVPCLVFEKLEANLWDLLCATKHRGGSLAVVRSIALQTLETLVFLQVRARARAALVGLCVRVCERERERGGGRGFACVVRARGVK